MDPERDGNSELSTREEWKLPFLEVVPQVEERLIEIPRDPTDEPLGGLNAYMPDGEVEGAGLGTAIELGDTDVVLGAGLVAGVVAVVAAEPLEDACLLFLSALSVLTLRPSAVTWVRAHLDPNLQFPF